MASRAEIEPLILIRKSEIYMAQIAVVDFFQDEPEPPAVIKTLKAEVDNLGWDDNVAVLWGEDAKNTRRALLDCLIIPVTSPDTNPGLSWQQKQAGYILGIDIDSPEVDVNASVSHQLEILASF